MIIFSKDLLKQHNIVFNRFNTKTLWSTFKYGGREVTILM